MVPKFNHFVITRFNLKQSIWQNDKKGGAVNDEAWLTSRYHLFEHYCFPSLVEQSEQQFTWLVFFDTDTPIRFKTKNEVLHQQFKNFIPIYVPSFSDFEKGLDTHIRALLDKKCSYIITTRLDNDDCFHQDAITAIQQNFIEKDRTIIDLVHGLSLQINSGFKLALKKDTVSGPFISLIEKIKGDNPLLTVYNREHLHWIGDAHFVKVDTDFYWLQIIHERNVSNTLGEVLTFNKTYLRGFDFLKRIHFSLSYRAFIILKKSMGYKLYKKFKNAYLGF